MSCRSRLESILFSITLDDGQAAGSYDPAANEHGLDLMKCVFSATAIIGALFFNLSSFASGAGNAQSGASEIDTGNLFGFSDGADIGNKGDRGVELEFNDRFGKWSGGYNVLNAIAKASFTVTDSIQITPSVLFSRFDVNNAPGLADRSSGGLDAAQIDIKYRLLERERAGFGLMLGVTPHVHRLDEITGFPATAYRLDFLLAADKELAPQTLFAALNLRYLPGIVHDGQTRAWERDSTLQFSGAISARVLPSVFIGVEARYRVAFEGLMLNRFSGSAVHVGPTLFTKLSEKAWLSAAWGAQIAGHAAGEARNLDLTNFERHEFKLKLGCEL